VLRGLHIACNSREEMLQMTCNAMHGTASYTYPVAFTYTSWYPTGSGLVGATVVTAVSTTAVTITKVTQAAYNDDA
jgi:hypothetical protein